MRSMGTPPHCFVFLYFSLVVVNNYLSSRFFFRNFFVATPANVADDDDDSAVEHVSVVFDEKYCVVKDLSWLGEIGWTSLGKMGNNLISFGRVVWIWIEFGENDVNSDNWDWFFEIFCCFEHQ